MSDRSGATRPDRNPGLGRRRHLGHSHVRLDDRPHRALRWNLFRFIGAIAVSSIGDPRALGLDAAVPASFLALLAALVAVQTFAGGQQLGVDARVAGVGAAVVALPLRAPFIAAVVVAATTAALLRSSGWLS